ncbi:3-carboxy-cis,cis-mucoante lactonizing enzyme [Heliocybe sulcata]|uniref:3-carboxy-cis,cis-mucoante lactonizing enzyme n=1 Tax=Heliocybe sulcata TaxID=5364 RepID=A0A5C3N3P6_9AGAM|nr:3-carboxy-cis,cis-mucoante lactonizing enzyme [Heliocybe sulcata]
MSTYHIAVASYSHNIYALQFSTSPPELKVLSTLEVGYHPSWITPHPSDRSTIFAAIEDESGRVVEIKHDESGKGAIVGTCTTSGNYPCTTLVVGQELLVGNYMSGQVVIIPLAPSSPYIKSTSPSQSIQLHGSGPNTLRQNNSHTHDIYKVPDRDEVLVADLGADKTWRLVKGQSGWEIAGSIDYRPGSGPRHLLVHNDFLYTVLELHNELSQHTLPPLDSSEKPTHIMSVATHIPSSSTNLLRMLAAEILLSTSIPPLLYVSNRNDPTPGGDTIAIFSLSSAGPKRIAEVKTGLHHLRGMILFGPDDKYLIAGGTFGGEGGVVVKVFERVDGGNGLQEVAGLSGLGEMEEGPEELLKGPTGFVVLSDRSG